jgi:hypothetical protein
MFSRNVLLLISVILSTSFLLFFFGLPFEPEAVGNMFLFLSSVNFYQFTWHYVSETYFLLILIYDLLSYEKESFGRKMQIYGPSLD